MTKHFSNFNGPNLRHSKSSKDPIVVMKFEFYAHSARLLRKLDHGCKIQISLQLPDPDLTWRVVSMAQLAHCTLNSFRILNRIPVGKADVVPI